MTKRIKGLDSENNLLKAKAISKDSLKTTRNMVLVHLSTRPISTKESGLTGKRKDRESILIQ